MDLIVAEVGSEYYLVAGIFIGIVIGFFIARYKYKRQ